LSKKATGIEVAAGYGSPSASGGGQNQKASITAGFGDLNTDGYSVVLSGSYEKEKRYLDVTALMLPHQQCCHISMVRQLA
jgi:hypothetical protein